MEIFDILFFCIFFLALAVVLIGLVKGIAQWNKNNHSPRLTVSATVASKRTQVTHNHHNDAAGGMYMTSSTLYYVTFQVESGDRMELSVGGGEYGMLAEGDFRQAHLSGNAISRI